jgi:hypothetical protein
MKNPKQTYVKKRKIAVAEKRIGNVGVCAK